MGWHIVEQEESIGRGQTMPVKCKHLRFFPVKNRQRREDDEVSFGRFSHLLFKMILAHDTGAENTITWSNKSGKGKYIYHFADRFEHPTYKAANGREYPDTLSPKVKKPGPTREFTNPEAFLQFLRSRLGEELASEVLVEFDNRLDAA